MLPDTPFSTELAASVEALYLLAPTHVPKSLVVCHCPVCMTPETRATIVATPVRDLPPELIREYSNSAHGDPTDPDDLNALLPRYLDLIAQDIEVDWNSVGSDLQRFGDARGTLKGFPAPGMAEEMDRYARALILHFGTLQARDEDLCETPWMLLEVLLIGGWPFATLAAALDELFYLPDIGRPALMEFLADIGCSLRDGRIELWALSRYRTEVAADLAQWLDRLLASDAFTDIVTDPALPERAALWVPSVAGLRGRLNAGMFGG
ncbi:MAG: hypothetical protein MUE83_16545 [Tabrizicola sp.]|nr:hypothetical protein [Tabrizicola sp.]